MEDRVIPLLGFFGAIVLLLLVGLLARVTRKRRASEEKVKEDEEEKRLALGVGTGELRRDELTGTVFVPCTVCGKPASERAPRSGISWMDKLPLLNRLHSLAPRYILEETLEGPYEFCPIHKNVAVKKIEEFHASLRSERAQFNSMQEDKVAQMDGGALKRGLQEQHRAMLPSISEAKRLPTAPPSMPSATVTSSREVGMI